VARARRCVPARLSSIEVMCADHHFPGLTWHSLTLPGIQTPSAFRPHFQLRLEPEPKHASGSIVGRPASRFLQVSLSKVPRPSTPSTRSVSPEALPMNASD
jgi:hypothetical protein